MKIAMSAAVVVGTMVVVRIVKQMNVPVVSKLLNDYT